MKWGERVAHLSRTSLAKTSALEAWRRGDAREDQASQEIKRIFDLCECFFGVRGVVRGEAYLCCKQPTNDVMVLIKFKCQNVKQYDK